MFVPGDFLDLGSREAVDLALHRLTRKGTIRRLARGVYDFPKEHPVLGLLSPSADAVARALAEFGHSVREIVIQRANQLLPARIRAGSEAALRG